MTGITFLKAQILSRSSKKWFDITPVCGYKEGSYVSYGPFFVSIPWSTPQGTLWSFIVPRHVLEHATRIKLPQKHSPARAGQLFFTVFLINTRVNRLQDKDKAVSERRMQMRILFRAYFFFNLTSAWTSKAPPYQLLSPFLVRLTSGVASEDMYSPPFSSPSMSSKTILTSLGLSNTDRINW